MCRCFSEVVGKLTSAMHALLHLDLSRNPGLWRCPEVLLLVLRNLPRVQKVYLDTAVSPAELGAILAKN